LSRVSTRSVAAVVALLLVSIGACGAEKKLKPDLPARRRPLPQSFEQAPEPAPSPSPGRELQTNPVVWANGLPPLVVARGSRISRHRDGRITSYGAVEGNAEVAFAGSAGTAIVQSVSGKRSELVVLRRNRAERIQTSPAHISLMDVAVIDGRRRVLYTTYYEPAAERGETSGYLYAQELRNAKPERITEASGPEYEITRASYGGGVIVTSAWADLTEAFNFLRPDGSVIKDRPNPTNELQYGRPPYMSDAVLSPDGSSLAYLEGPDFDPATEKQVGNWVVVVQDQTTGRELLRVKVANGDVCVPWLDYDGRWLVVSRAKWTRGTDAYDVCRPTASKALAAVVLDSTDPRALVQLSETVGVATIDD
jgi:hypothetical protein